MTTVIRLVVLTSARTNVDLPPVRRNSTRFLPRPRRKYLPVMTSFSPTFTLMGVTLVITGVFTAAPAVAGTTSAPSAARTAAPRSARRVRDRFSIALDIGHPGGPLEPEAVGC